MDRYDKFVQFLSERATDITRIARISREPLEDVKQSAWIVAEEIERETGIPVNLADADQQNNLLDRIRRLLNRLRSKQPHALSLDQPVRADDSSDATFVDYLKADADSDPIERMLSREHREENRNRLLAICRKSFSQLSAYLLLLLRDEGEEQSVATELGITRITLKQRLKRLLWASKIQRSLFDGITQVMPDFLPLRARPNMPRTIQIDGLQPLQREFNFSADVRR